MKNQDDKSHWSQIKLNQNHQYTFFRVFPEMKVKLLSLNTKKIKLELPDEDFTEIDKETFIALSCP
jgi:hypothetical protein